MDLIKNVVHRIANRARDGAVDRRCCRLVFLCPGVRDDSSGRYRTAAQCPQKFLVKLFALRLDFDTRERHGDTLVGVVYRIVDLVTVFSSQSILRIPNIELMLLETRCR